MRTDVAVVVAGGGPVAQHVPDEIRDGWPVVAADSGLEVAQAAGLDVTTVVGDFDSVDPDALALAERRGAAVHRYPADKDLTDLELAIRHVRGVTALRRLVVLGGAAGRLDHLLANLAVLTGPATRGLEVEAWLGRERVVVVRDAVQLDVVPGATVSLLAWHGRAEGVTTSGLRWPLADAVLQPGAALGTSNEAVADRIDVSVRTGVLSVVLPHHPRLAEELS